MLAFNLHSYFLYFLESVLELFFFSEQTLNKAYIYNTYVYVPETFFFFFS